MEDWPEVDVVCVYAEKDVLQAVSADHVARGAEEVLKALPTLPQHTSYLLIIATMATGVGVLQTCMYK